MGRQLRPQDLVCLLWAGGKLLLRPMALLRASDAWEDLGGWSPQHLAMSAWALGALGVRGRLLDLVATEATRRMRSLRPQHLANIAWAFAALELRQPRLFGAIARATEERIREFGQQHLCNMAGGPRIGGVPRV